VCGTADQTPRDARDDVVLFESDELAEPTAVVGQIFARLFVSSSAKARPLMPLCRTARHCLSGP
jgi:predicted acyl esterase